MHHPELQKIISERHPQNVGLLLATLATNSQLSATEEKLLAIVARQQEQLTDIAARIGEHSAILFPLQPRA